METEAEIGVITETEAETEMEIGIMVEATAETEVETGTTVEVIVEEGIIREIKVEVETKIEIKAGTETVESSRRHIKESIKLSIITIKTKDTIMIEILKTEVKVEKDQIVEIEQDLKHQTEQDTEGKVQEEHYSTEVEVKVMKEK